MNKTILFSILFVILSSLIYAQQDSVITKYHPKLSVYVMPISIADPYYPTLRIGVDYLLYKNLKTDFDIQIFSFDLIDDNFSTQKFFGSRIQIKYSMNTKSTNNREFRFNTGFEFYYNYASVLCNDHYYYEGNNYSKIVYYEEAHYVRNKYGLNIIFSINVVKRRFYIEPYWGLGIAYVKYNYYDVKNSISENIENKSPYSQKGFDNYFKFPERRFTKFNLVLGLKIGYVFIKD